MFNGAYISEVLLHRRKTEWSVFLQLGTKLLHFALKKGAQRIVELLLDKGVNTEVMDKVWCCFAKVSRLVEFLVCI